MKKRLLLLIAITSLIITIGGSPSAMARPVDQSTARKVATNYLKTVTGKSYATLTDITAQTPFREFYLFALGQQGGFILVSADDCVVPILGYSENTPFVAEAMPAHVREWMDKYEEQIAFYRSRWGDLEYGGSQEVQTCWQQLLNDNLTMTLPTAVSPLVTTTWNQSPLYNNLCPVDVSTGDSLLTVTGCAATAAAQIMKYWNHPTTGYGSEYYTHATYGYQSANFGNTTYAWSNMPTALTATSSTTQVNAVATLMYHIGVAIHMRYGISSRGGSSGATTSWGDVDRASVENALMKYFKYKNTCHSIYYGDFTDDEWKSMLRAELDASRPILYTGYDTSAGHAFVFDGYDNQGMFHVNWGWGGYCDGYYALGYLNPAPGGTGGNATYTFNLDNYALIGIEPNNSWSSSAITAVTLNVSNNSAGSATGAGTYAFGDTIVLSTTANEGCRFYKWSDGSTIYKRSLLAVGGNMNLTATIEPLSGDTLDYCFNTQYASWGSSDTSTHQYWGMRLPASVLVGHAPLTSVMMYSLARGEYDLTIFTGDTAPTNVLYIQRYTIHEENAWVNMQLSTPLAVNGTQNLWIFIHSQGIAHPMAISWGCGNGDASMYVFNADPLQAHFSLGGEWAFMLRAVFGHSSSGTTGCPAQVVTIGDENSTTTSYNTPVNNWYKYTLSETIVDAAEIGGPLTVSSLSFYLDYPIATTSKTNCTIYFQPTTKTAFANASDIELLNSNAVMVYIGNLNCTPGWNEITLNTPYAYDGTTNLMVIVDDNSNDYDGNSYVFRTTSCTANKTLTWYSDNLNPDPTSSSFSGSSNVMQSRALMRLKGCPPCNPAEIEIGDITSSTSENNIPYVPFSTYYHYSLTESIIDAAEIGGPMEINAISYKYAHTSPTTSTNYGIKIWIKPTTKQEFATLTDIELVDANATLVYEGSPSFSQGWNDLTFSNSYSYDGTSNLVVIVIDTVHGHDSYSHKFNTAVCTGYKTICWCSLNVIPDPTSTTYNGSKYRREYRPVMMLKGCNYSGPSCPTPTHVAVAGATANAVSVTWDASDAASFMVEVNSLTGGTVATSSVTTNSATLTGLTANTSYSVHVRALCYNGDTSDWSMSVSFSTSCNATTLPFAEGFEYGIMPDCWTTEGPGTWSVGTGDYNNGTGSHTGNYNVLITHNTTGDITKLISPAINFAGASSAELRFWHIQREWGGDQDVLTVYYRSSASSDWQSLATYDTNITTWTEEIISLPNLSNYYQIAFEMTDGYGYGVAIDDISINLPGSCLTPFVTADSVVGRTLHLSWSHACDSIYLTVINTLGQQIYGWFESTTSGHRSIQLPEQYFPFGWSYIATAGLCGTTDTTGWAFDEFIVTCDTEEQCTITYLLTDSYGDGWNGGVLTVYDSITGVPVSSMTAVDHQGQNTPFTDTYQYSLCTDRTYLVHYTGGIYDFEVSFIIQGANGDTLFTYARSTLDTGDLGYFHFICGQPQPPIEEDIATVPFTCSFEQEGNNGWQFVNDNQGNYWMVGNATNNGGSHAMYITNDGSTNTYSFTSASYSFATRLIRLSEPGDYAFSFDWMAYGESSYDFLRAALVPASTTITAGSYSGFDNNTQVPTGGIALDGGRLNQVSSWQNRSGIFNISDTGLYKIVFMWRNDISVGTNPPAAIDNVTLTHNNCPMVQNVVALPTPSSISLTWTAGGSEQAWMVSCGTVSSLVTTPAYTFTGLQPDNDYTVSIRALCNTEPGSVGDTSLAYSLSIHTPCNWISTLPYFEDFDNITTSTTAATGASVPCWSLAHRDVDMSASQQPQVYYNSSHSHSGDYSLRMYYRCIYALPGIDTNINELEMSLWVKQTNSSYQLVVGVMSNLNDVNTFVPVDTLDCGSNYNSPEYFTVNFSNYTGGGHYIAFRNISSSTYSYNYIDDVTVDFIPDCPTVTGLVANPDPLQGTASFSWDASSNVQGYDLRVSTANGTVLYHNTTTTNSATVTIATNYYEQTLTAQVRAICGSATSASGDTSSWSLPVSFYVGYCMPTPSSQDGSGITQVSFGTGSETVSNTQRPLFAPYYGNYHNLVGAVPVGTQAQVDITYSTGYTYGTIIWVDWNKNYQFESNEVVYAGESNDSVPTTLTATFAIPSTQDTGLFRMRIAGADLFYDSYTGSIALAANADPCPQNTSYSVVHDYSLRVVASTTPPVDTTHTTTTVSASVTACDSYTWRGTTYTASTIAYDTVVNNVTRHDTLFILNLTINYSSQSIDSVTACDSYTWHGTTYTSSTNTPVHVYTSTQGCDSTVTLHLTIHYSSQSIDSVTACDSYTWHGTTYTSSTNTPVYVYTNTQGCDSTVTLYLTINYSTETQEEVTATDSYTWHDTTYTESGSYTWTGTTTEGCDSVVTLVLTITHDTIGIQLVEGIEVNLYPNPTTGKVTIQADQVLKVEVYDPQGRHYRTFNNTATLNLGDLPSGQYLLHITLPNDPVSGQTRMAVTKIIKL